MAKSVLLVNQSTGYLMTDIVNAYVASGNFDKVELFAGEINIRPSVPDQSVKIIKTIKYNKQNTIKRLWTWLAAFIHLLFVVWRRNKDCFLFLVSNPPLTIFVPLLTRKKYCYVVYDLYPDSLFSQGFVKRDSVMGKWWSKINRKVFANAECVFTLSEDMKKAVSRYVSENKIRVVYNWAHNEHMRPVEKCDNLFLRNYQMQDKFVVLYSGNMGMTHDIDVMVDVAEKLKDNRKIEFFFIGEGAKKAIIEKKIMDYSLDNCIVLPFQPLEMLPYSMGSADVAVVTTDNRQSGLSVPSKTYTYLATGSVLLCLADENTELGRLTKESKTGKCFDSKDVYGMASFIECLSNDESELMSYKENSRRTSLLYTPENAKQYVI